MKFFNKIFEILCIPILLITLLALTVYSIFDKTNYEAAWKNESKLLKHISSEWIHTHQKEYRIIIKGVVYLKNHKKILNEESRIMYDFFKRNNIDLYSENFDPNYVAKCIREQEIC